MKGKTVYVKTKDFGKYLKDNNLSISGSAGPYPNITGMRKLYWGKDCLVIKSGAYAYKVV